MNTILKTLAAVAMLAALISGQAAAMDLPAPMPEFRSQQELQAEIASRAAASEQAIVDQPRNEAFFTGKPHDRESGAHIFLFRNYDPELSRWTASDPSGFPDGANNQAYLASPVSTLDIAGLRSHHVFSTQVHTISFTVGVYDHSGATTTQRLSGWASAVASAWTFSGIDKADGVSSLSFQTDISFHLISGTLDETAALSQFDNLVTFIPSDETSYVDSTFRRGFFRDNIEPNVVVHEVGHFMTVADFYYPGGGGPKAGWEGSIMGSMASAASKMDVNEVLRLEGETVHVFE